MGKRAIGIDVSEHWVRAVQILREGDELRMERVFEAPTRRSTDSARDLIRGLWQAHGFDGKADIAVALPHHSVFYRDLRIDRTQLEQLRQGDATVLANHVPLAPSQIVPQICTERSLDAKNTFVLLAAVGQDAVQERLQVFAFADVTPRLMEAELPALRAAVAVHYPESQQGTCMLAYLDDAHLALAIVENGHILLIRNTPLQWLTETENPEDEMRLAQLITQEAQVTWQKAFGHTLDPNSTLYICQGATCSESLRTGIERHIGCTTHLVDPGTRLALSSGESTGANILLAQGLALRALDARQENGVNFLKLDVHPGRGQTRRRHELIILAALAVAIVAVWLVGVFSELWYLEHRYEQVKQETYTAFHTLLPEEGTPVNPVAQLQRQLDRLQAEVQQLRGITSGTGDALMTLRNLARSQSTPGDVLITDLLITGDTVRVTGSCPNFDAMHQWQTRLASVPGWERIQVDPRRDPPSTQVRFTLVIDLAQES